MNGKPSHLLGTERWAVVQVQPLLRTGRGGAEPGCKSWILRPAIT